MRTAALRSTERGAACAVSLPLYFTGQSSHTGSHPDPRWKGHAGEFVAIFASTCWVRNESWLPWETASGSASGSRTRGGPPEGGPDTSFTPATPQTPARGPLRSPLWPAVSRPDAHGPQTPVCAHCPRRGGAGRRPTPGPGLGAPHASPPSALPASPRGGLLCPFRGAGTQGHAGWLQQAPRTPNPGLGLSCRMVPREPRPASS